MAQSFKYSGGMRYTDDSQLWNEILLKERGVNQMHAAYKETDIYANNHASQYGGGKLNQTQRNAALMNDISNNKLAQT